MLFTSRLLRYSAKRTLGTLRKINHTNSITFSVIIHLDTTFCEAEQTLCVVSW
jgi:hypothetical protein